GPAHGGGALPLNGRSARHRQGIAFLYPGPAASTPLFCLTRLCYTSFLLCGRLRPPPFAKSLLLYGCALPISRDERGTPSPRNFSPASPRVSPEGAIVNSQGRQPLVPKRRPASQPRRGGSKGDSIRFLSPLQGSFAGPCPRSRG